LAGISIFNCCLMRRLEISRKDDEWINLTGRSCGNPSLIACSTSSVVYIMVNGIQTTQPERQPTSSSSSRPNSKHNLSNSSVAGKDRDQRKIKFTMQGVCYSIHGQVVPRDLLYRLLPWAFWNEFDSSF
jgi:hypothetical protein